MYPNVCLAYPSFQSTPNNIFSLRISVNADFSDDAQVDRILDSWEEFKPEASNSSHHKKGFGGEEDGQIGVTESKRAPLQKEIPIMFRRHVLLIIRDRT
jgi:hypothetical protein